MRVTTKTPKQVQPWFQLTSQVEEFQEITRILVEFDERKNRIEKYAQPELHYLRKATTLCDVDTLEICIRHRGAYVYDIIASCQIPQGHFSTLWIHEDGIQVERENHVDEVDHPVHNIVCLTDLFRHHCRRLQHHELSSPVSEYIDSEQYQEVLLRD